MRDTKYKRVYLTAEEVEIVKSALGDGTRPAERHEQSGICHLIDAADVVTEDRMERELRGSRDEELAS